MVSCTWAPPPVWAIGVQVWKSFRRDCTHTHTWWFSSSSRLATLSALSSNGKRIHKKQTANFYGIGRRRQLEHSSANYFSFPIRSLQQQQQQQQHPPAQSSRTQGSTISYSIIYRQKTYPTVCVCVTISFLLPLCIVEGWKRSQMLPLILSPPSE